MAQKNAAVMHVALREISAKHPDWTTEKALAAAAELDGAGLLSLNKSGGLFLDTNSEAKFADILRIAPNLVPPPEGDTDRAKIARSRICAAKLGEAPPKEPDPVQIKARLAALPKLPAGASDRLKCLRAAERERIMLGFGANGEST